MNCLLSQKLKTAMKKLILTILLSSVAFAQNVEKGYFRNPLDIPMQLSGNFGELRPNHFHAGFDLKTNQREGLNVYAVADGYISRIKISNFGYGKAIYVTHPNGYTSVYGHLQKAVGNIEARILKEQYDQKAYEVEIFLNQGEITVKKGEQIAFSGNTGGSDGPHLHFEIRESATEKVVNPLSLGLDVKDSKAPVVSQLLVYPTDKNSWANDSKRPTLLNLSLQTDGTYVAEKVLANGKIGFGFSGYDFDNVSYNQNGIYKVKLSTNGSIMYHYAFDKMVFDEARYINALIDYARYKKTRQRVQKLFTKNNANWSNLYTSINDGILAVAPNFSETATLEVSDFYNNKVLINIPIEFTSKPATVESDVKETKYFVKSKTDAIFEKQNVTVTIPPNTFYEDFYLNFDVNNKVLNLGEDLVPASSNFTITFDDNSIPQDLKSKTFIATINNSKLSYNYTKNDGNSYSCKSKNLGQYKLVQDTTAPVINLKKIDEKKLAKQNAIALTISDDLSGVKSINGYMNGQWVLFEYESKLKRITHNFVDKYMVDGINALKIVVTDNVGNTATVETSFNWKKNK